MAAFFLFSSIAALKDTLTAKNMEFCPEHPNNPKRDEERPRHFSTDESSPLPRGGRALLLLFFYSLPALQCSGCIHL